jgi:hypothetical protein
MPNRRVAIQQLFFICAGAAVLPACFRNEEQASIPLTKIKISGDQEKMLAELAETIIPKTDTPGAKDLSTDLFILNMVDDCFPKEKQEKFTLGMKAFETFAEKKSGRSFADSSPEQKQAVVAELDGRKSPGDDLLFFYRTVKQLSTQAYSSSQFYLTNIRHYKMIPGKNQGCVPLKVA